MKKILFVCYSLQGGGTERVASTLANHFQKVGNSVSFLTFLDNSTDFYELDPNISRLTLNMNKEQGHIFQNHIKYLLKLREIFLGDYDFIISFWTNINIYSIISHLFIKNKLIVTEHIDYNSTKIHWKILRRIFFKYADAVITLTENNKNIFKRYLNNVYVIENPNPLQISKRSDLNKKNIISIGRLEYQKGFDYLLNAFKLVNIKHPDWKLYLIGKGSLEKDLKNQAYQLGLDNQVIFIKETDHISEYYLDSSIYVMTSRFEGLPMVLIESQSYGIPAVSFDCPTGPKEIIINEYNGFLVDLGDIEGANYKINNLIEDIELRKKMGHNAILMSSRFDISEIYSKWEEIFTLLQDKGNSI